MLHLLHDRAPLNVLTHELKLKKFSKVQMSNEVMMIIIDDGWLPLVDCLFTMLDTPFLSGFVER